MSNRIFIFLAIISLALIETTFSQVTSPTWTWISGSDLINQHGNYGTKGIPSSLNVPGAREGAVSWTDSNNNFWLFGGFGWDATNSYPDWLNDLWKYDGTNWTWISGSNATSQRATYGTKGIPSLSNVPGARKFVASWTDSNDNLWLFGGWGYATSALFNYLNDLWRFDGVNWTWISGLNSTNQRGIYGTKGIASSSNVPGARSFATTWIDSSDTLWLFGGFGNDATNSPVGHLNDLWKFNGVNWTWISGSSLTNQNGNYGTKGIVSPLNIPGARVDAASWIDSNNNLWLFGGYGYPVGIQGFLNDLWKFNGINWVWISGSDRAEQNGTYGTKGIPSPSNIPGARVGALSWIDSDNNLWLFGQRAYYGELNDMWKYDGTYWTWMSGSNLLDQRGDYGTKGVASPSNVPGARADAISWKDSSNNFWIFGGVQDNGIPEYLNDLWKLELPPSITSGSLTSNSLTTSIMPNADSGTSTIRTTSIILIIFGILTLVV